MDCSRCRAYLTAMIDDELDVADRTAVAAHLRSCAGCREEAEQVRSLKQALARTLGGDRAPAGFSDRVLAELRNEASVAPAPRSAAQRWVGPLAAAAAIAFVLFVGPSLWNNDDEPAPGNAVQARWVGAVRTRHTGCVRMGDAHHMIGVDRDFGTIQARLADLLGIAVSAPDLTKAGLELIGGDLCGLGGVRAAHVLFRRPADGLMVSVFSLPFVEGLSPSAGFVVGSKPCFAFSGPGSAVVAWHEAGTTYVVCGETTPAELAEMIEAIR